MNSPPSRTAILRFPGDEHPDLPLHAGMNGLCRDPDLDRGLMMTPGGGSSLIEFCADARGLWLHVAEGERGVHVNGRPVQRLAYLHVGDTIHCEGVEMLLADPQPRMSPVPASLSPQPSRLLLRGHGGSVHGQSVTLDDVREVGGRQGIAVDGQPKVIGTLVPLGDNSAYLRLASDQAECRLNGWPVTQARVQAGDQLLFAPGCRYLVESPGDDPSVASASRRVDEEVVAVPPLRRAGWTLPWLLLAAGVSALLLAALLWFGVK